MVNFKVKHFVASLGGNDLPKLTCVQTLKTINISLINPNIILYHVFFIKHL